MELPCGRFKPETIALADGETARRNAMDPEMPKDYASSMRIHNQAIDNLEQFGIPYAALSTNVFLLAGKLYYWPRSWKVRFKGRQKIYRPKTMVAIQRLLEG